MAYRRKVEVSYRRIENSRDIYRLSKAGIFLVISSLLLFIALNGLYCADVPLRHYSLAHSLDVVNTTL